MQSRKITFEIKKNLINVSKKSIDLIEDDNTFFFFIGQINNIDKLLKKFKINNESKKIEQLFKLYNLVHDKIIKLLEGSFSIIIINKLTKESKIFRDLGSSFPVYYSFFNDTLFIGNDLNSIVQKNNYSKQPDFNTISRYIIYGELNNSPSTFYKNIKRIQPGSLFTIKNLNEFSNELIKIKFNNRNIKPKEVRNLFENIVNNSNSENDKIAVPLSGGLDSTAITTIIKNNKNAKFYSLIVEGTNDESELINETVKIWNLDHKYIDWESDYNKETVDFIIKLLAEPYKSPQSLTQYSLRKQANKDACNILYYGEGGGLFGKSHNGKGFWTYIPELILNFRIINAIKHCYFLSNKNYFRTIIIFVKQLLFSLLWLKNYKIYPNKSKDKTASLQTFKKKYNFKKEFINLLSFKNNFYKTRNTFFNPFKSNILSGIVSEVSPYQLNVDFVINENFNIIGKYPLLNSELIKLILGSEINNFFSNKLNKAVWRNANKDFFPNHINKEQRKFFRPSNNFFFYNKFIKPDLKNKDFIDFLGIFFLNPHKTDFINIKKNDHDYRFWIRLYLLWRWTIVMKVDLKN